jgi:dihydrofolate reductase
VTRPRVTLIVARARNGAIGQSNRLPWRLPEDLQHFKATTLGHPILMGRRTFDSIGRPLPGRRNLILSRDPHWHHPGCERVGSLAEALQRCQADDTLFVAGGDQVYRQALAQADRILLTEIDLDVPGADAWFASPDPTLWQCRPGRPLQSQTGLHYRIDDWQRLPCDSQLP